MSASAATSVPAAVVVSGPRINTRTGVKSASDFLKSLASTRSAKVDLEGLAEALTDEWGGVKGLAKACKLEFNESMTGSMNKGRILANVMEIICKASAKQTSTDPLEGMEDGDLERAISKAMKETNASDPA
jgi:hypothetical protein